MNGVDVTDATVLPLGTTTVTFRIADSFGNVGTATSEVFVAIFSLAMCSWGAASMSASAVLRE